MQHPVTIKRSRRKTLGLYVKQGQVEVRAPLFVGDQEIQQWLQQKQGWISEKLQEQQQKQAEQPSLAPGSQLLFFGKPRTLHFTPGQPCVLEHDDEQLIIRHKTNTDTDKLISNWLKQEASHYLTARTWELADEMQLTERISAIGFRKTRSKWGHCTSTGRLQFNWLAIMAPPEVIDYLIIHELSHLEHLNHSRAFWQRVASHCPDYKIHRRWFRDHGHRIWL